MIAVRLPAVMAVAAALVVAATVSCCPPTPAPVVRPCPMLRIPPRPQLPISQYRPEWTKDQLLKAYTESTALLLGAYAACVEVMQAHNIPPANAPAAPPKK